MQIEDLGEPMRIFVPALQIQPDHDASLTNKAMVSLQLRKYDEAILIIPICWKKRKCRLFHEQDIHLPSKEGYDNAAGGF